MHTQIRAYYEGEHDNYGREKVQAESSTADEFYASAKVWMAAGYSIDEAKRMARMSMEASS